MFSTEFAYLLEAAYKEASSRKHQYFCLEHILFALIHNDNVREIIKQAGGDVDTLKADLEKYFDESIETVALGDDQRQFEIEEIAPIQTTAVQNVLERAIIQMKAAGKNLVTEKEVLIQILDEPDSHAAYYLKKQGLTKIELIHYITHGISKLPLFDNSDKQLIVREKEQQQQKSAGKYLRLYTENLTEEAKKGTLDPVIGRDLELQRVIQILSRRQKNNPILIGDAGVGKTAMAAGLAQKIVRGEVPDILKESELFVLEVGTLIAGTKFRGELEERLQLILKDLSELPNPILFIDEIHTLVGAGSTGAGSLDAANLLKPALAKGLLRCIGSTTHDEFKKSFEKDRALNRRFSKVTLNEPTVAETVEILKGLKKHFEDYHNVTFSDLALEAAAKLSAKHINDRFLPDKAIDVLDEAAASNNLLVAKKRKAIIGEKEIANVVAMIAGVPVDAPDDQDSDHLANIEIRLKERVFGQDAAVDAVCKAIKRSRASLQDDRKPIGSFLFAGPTGVGKTELAKELASVLKVPFQRFDMSEYMEKHAVARLVGAPPGYVGYDEGGILTDLVRKQPYAVILLDEIEKAHYDVFNILLQIMDDATLTDAQGRKADFRNCILIMTSNVGSESSNALGFGNSQFNSKREQAVKQMFRPEFRNRLDETIYFQALPTEVVLNIVDKFIADLAGKLLEKKIKLQLSLKAREYLASKGFDTQLGARPMRRLIQKEIKDALADEILFGRLKKGGDVQIDLVDEKLIFQFA